MDFLNENNHWLQQLRKLPRSLGRNTSPVHPLKTARNITLIYATLGFVWIYSSDWILSSLFKNPEYLSSVNLIKGWVYVLATSLLLFLLIFLVLTETQQHEECRQRSYEALEQIHGELALSEQRLRQQLKDNQEYQNRLHYLAYFDVLTDLPNRLSLQEDLRVALNQEEQLALFFVDLDNFKDVNDFRSHEAGDRLLQKVARRIVDTVGAQGTVYRFGGDEFIVVAFCPSQEEGQKLAKDIILSLKEPFRYQSSLVHLTASIGLTHTGARGYSSADLIRFADLAMHDSKKRGGNCYTVYHQELSRGAIDRVLLEQQLRNALEKNQLTLYYQPEVLLPSHQIGGFEALLRWEPQEVIDGTVEQVIRIAESTGLIIPIGEWILREACTFLKQIHALGHTRACISVNVSIVQFSRTGFPHTVQKILREVDLDPSFLRLEITESILMESYDLIDQQIEALRKIGVKMALDDFGKGYSSLSYLKVLPLDTLKIDKSFIDHIPENSKDAFLTSQIIAIGKNLDLQVVAEGVESADQLNYLQERGCDSFQGYLYSPPVSNQVALSLLEESHS